MISVALRAALDVVLLRIAAPQAEAWEERAAAALAEGADPEVWFARRCAAALLLPLPPLLLAGRWMLTCLCLGVAQELQLLINAAEALGVQLPGMDAVSAAADRCNWRGRMAEAAAGKPLPLAELEQVLADAKDAGEASAQVDALSAKCAQAKQLGDKVRTQQGIELDNHVVQTHTRVALRDFCLLIFC